MILTVLVATLASASPEPLKLATTPFQFVNISPQLATFCSEHFAQQLTLEGIRVTTSSEISTLLGFERQKELMGCADKSTSCIAELANALGVDGLVTGTVGKFGKAYQVNIKILAAKDGRSLAAYSGRVRDEEAILDEYTQAAKKLAPTLFRKLARAPIAASQPVEADAAPAPAPEPKVVAQAPTATAAEVTEVSSGGGGLRRKSWIPAAAGVVFAGVGTGLLLGSGAKAGALSGGELSVKEAEEARDAGATMQTLGAVGLGVGAAALATAGAMFLFGGESSPPSVMVGVMATPDHAGVTFSGVFR